MKTGTTTFAGGIIGPGLWGRVDLAKYQTGVKSATNFLVAVEGGLEKRFGTYLVGKPKYQDRVCKLIPWRISNDDSYILEFGDHYIRFIRFGGYVTIPEDHEPHDSSTAENVLGFMEVATPYTPLECLELKFTFANDIMYIFHNNHAPRELRRYGLFDWELALQNFTPYPAWAGGPVTATYYDNTVEEDAYTPYPIPTEYRVSAIFEDGTESLASNVVEINTDLGHRKTRLELSWTAVPGAVEYVVYKSKSGLFGFIGYTKTPFFVDRNFGPVFDTVPIGDALVFGSSFPRAGEFYKQRMVYASTTLDPQALWISRPLVFNSLHISTPSQDDDAMKISIVGQKRHTINHMLQLNKFIMFTDTAEWILETLGGEALSPATVDPQPKTAYGSDPWLKPIAIGDRILFVQNISGNVRDLGLLTNGQSYQADDLTRLVRHLFKNTTIHSWDYADYPNNVLPCVVTNGLAYMLTYVREHEIWGWTTQETQGHYLDVACVPEQFSDATYYQVSRLIDGVWTTFVERTELNFSDRVEDMFYVDCGLSYRDDGNFADFIRLDEERAQIFLPEHALDLGDELQLEFIDNNEVIAIRRVTVESDLGSDTLIVHTAHGDTFESGFALDYSDSGIAYYCANTITDLDHLEGMEVWILADGKVIKDLTVVAGQINLPIKAARAHIGLPYGASMETLNLDLKDAAGKALFKTVADINVQLRNSRGVWVGASESPRELYNIEPRAREGYYDENAPLDGIYAVPTHVEWGTSAGVRIESRDPLPLNILNIMPDIIYA